MKKFIFILFLPTVAFANGPIFQHKDTFVQQEFENVYQNIGQQQSSVIPTGSKILFLQSSCPTGWTQDTSMVDLVVRISSTTGGTTGGTDSISNPPTHTHATASHVLTTAEIPAHHHTYRDYTTNSVFSTSGGTGQDGTTTSNTSDTGGGGGHDHGNVSSVVGFSPKYVNLIICTKN